jgi:hypothetical protein
MTRKDWVRLFSRCMDSIGGMLETWCMRATSRSTSEIRRHVSHWGYLPIALTSDLDHIDASGVKMFNYSSLVKVVSDSSVSPVYRFTNGWINLSVCRVHGMMRETREMNGNVHQYWKCGMRWWGMQSETWSVWYLDVDHVKAEIRNKWSWSA